MKAVSNLSEETAPLTWKEHSDFLGRLVGQTTMKIIQSKIVPMFMDISAFRDSNPQLLIATYINPNINIDQEIDQLDEKMKSFFETIYARIRPSLIPPLYQSNIDALVLLSGDAHAIDKLTRGVALPIIKELMQDVEAYSEENNIFPSIVDNIINY